jgi:4-hydroxy-3-polyprenylbenzoate decarboxylase
MIVVAITGASGVTYGVRLLEVLQEMGKSTALVVTDPARIILDYEMGMDEEKVKELTNHYYRPDDLTSAINSGSCRFESMVIVPCTMKTISAIATGFASNAVTRAGDVALKEGRRLVLENMLRISKEGGVILPAMPAFYHRPENIDDLIDFLVGKILDNLHIDHHLYRRWQGEIP